ncbi:PepN [Desulforapulum autotrophicum HRM2]|uniref:Aminopeptidase N n=1 Tax=Desulforapulum autotrophicum (strain ATCC 43914 / DSM 3382 / VKM B-1955 / HRM2) TaxID=177437 RepID=C0QFX7_DESAH|nr:aminopeptidase N [Desulforapulum autotrophicum]ACN15545.1 PepN [Desulforapulum autotrophicum HRM2]
MEKHTIKYLKDYRQPEYWIDSIDLQFDLHEDHALVKSLMKIRRNNEIADAQTPLVFDCEALEIVSVIAEDMILCPGEYGHENNKFTLFKVPETFTLEITTRIKPQDNTALSGLYRSGGTFCTQCEAEGFRRITCFPDRPDVMTTYSCIITADKEKYPVLLSNGNLIETGDLDHGRHYAHWKDPFKKPSYLFALVAGNLVCIEDTFKTCSNRLIDLRIYVEPENKDKCGHAMTALKQAMAWDEEKFGREYDLDLYQIVAVNDFNMGAMENKGLNVFNSKYVLASTETATDIDFMGIQGVIAHEYFHNWTGNRVTLKNWFQLSLKEGLTVFRDQEFTSDMNSRAVKRIADVRKLRAGQFSEDSGPMAHPVRPESYMEMNNFYTMTVYDKGAEVIRMISLILGSERFRQGMDLYFEKFDGMAVTTEDFVATMEEASGVDLGQFRLWYSQSGTPRVKMVQTHDLQTGTLTLNFSQTTPGDKNQKEKSAMHIPVQIGLLDKDGNEINNPNCGLFHLKTKTDSLVFENVPEKCIPSIFRGFSAPVKIETDYSDTDLAFLMARDTDPFNRWDAAQQLYFREIDRLLEKTQKKEPLGGVSPHVLAAFDLALDGAHTDRALGAKILTLPDENEIGENYENIDVEGIHRVRCFLKQGIAQQVRERAMAIINECASVPASDISFAAMAKRSLKNLLIAYVGSLDTPADADFVFEKFNQADSMTDEIAALTTLSQMTTDHRTVALERFYNKWKKDPLVIDKWFSVQAVARGDHGAGEVVKLSGHPDFSLKNPNRVRSLVGAFTFQNPMGFHTPGGEGYTFVADQIIALDRSNPQISARLVSGFNHWKRYDKNRQSRMQQELKRIITIQKPSRDVYEIVSKALDGTM